MYKVIKLKSFKFIKFIPELNSKQDKQLDSIQFNYKVLKFKFYIVSNIIK